MPVKRRIPLSSDLEHAIIHAIIKGYVAADVVDPAEVSKPARLVLTAIEQLRSSGAEPPFNFNSVFLACTEITGAPRDSLKQYLLDVQTAGAGVETKDILQRVRDKQILADLISEAGGMLQKGILDIGFINTLLESDAKILPSIETVATRIANGLPDPPVGLQLGSLPLLSRLTGGILGMWALAGEPGAGKSTLAWQIALDVATTIPVVVYDFENGFSVLMQRTKDIFGGNLDRIRSATSNIYVRDSIRTLDSDLGVVKPPALLVVDSVQKLPGSVEHRRTSLDRWVHKLEYLKKRGYYVLLVSEVGRAHYDSVASLSAFKETGEIEYSADAGIQLVAAHDNSAEAHIVKNRHRPHKGFATLLMRKKGAWVFREAGGMAETPAPYDEVLD